MQPLDYGRSFVIPDPDAPGNSPRQWIDSRTRIIDEAGGIHEDYLRTDLCVTEKTFGAGQIFPENTWCGSRTWGPTKTWFYRHRVDADVAQDSKRPQAMVYDTDGIWGPITRHLVELDAEELTEDVAIIEATRAGRVLVGQTEIWNESRRLRAIIEHPIKTMNTLRPDGFDSLKKETWFPYVDPAGRSGLYQVDTGPVPFAHLDRDCEHHYERIQLAHVAYNAPDLASFMLFGAKELTDETGAVRTRVNAYHEPVLLPAKNRIYAQKD